MNPPNPQKTLKTNFSLQKNSKPRKPQINSPHQQHEAKNQTTQNHVNNLVPEAGLQYFECISLSLPAHLKAILLKNNVLTHTNFMVFCSIILRFLIP